MINEAELAEALQLLSDGVRRLTVVCRQAEGQDRRLLATIILHIQPLIQELSDAVERRTMH